MGLRHVSDDFDQSLKDAARETPGSSWLPTDTLPLLPIGTGDNGAGDGGNGYFSGYLIDSSYAAFEPFNMAEAGAHATAAAHQTNIAYLDQDATQTAGIGGNGGDSNAAIGGSVSAIGSSGFDTIASGDNSAGNGGDGTFSGAMVHAPVAVFDPINIAVAGFHGAADAHQSNAAQFHQGAIQMAGVGGSGGSGNAAVGGSAAVAPPGSPDHPAIGLNSASGHGMTGTIPAAHHGLVGSDAIATGDNHAGDGGDGYFDGSLVHTAVALYDPINIAVAGYDSTAHADQSNNVLFDQTAFQMAGVGGDGGSGNAAIGGSASAYSALLGLIGSDVIATGGNSAGSGGEGHFAGSLVDLNIAIYAPINIAVAGPNSTADAQQTNNVEFDQGAIQIAGIGGHGGNDNAALGGDAALHLLSDLHLLNHA
jgi:hypothetical protein